MMKSTPIVVGAPDGMDPDAILRGEHFEGRGGARVLVTAGIHGDEATSVAAAWYLSQALADRSVACEASVTVLPCVNPAAVRASSRLIPLDDLDVNRSFPGDSEGNSAERIAAALVGLLPDHDLLIDLHTAGHCVPFVLLDPVDDPDRSNRLHAWAASGGLPVVGELARARLEAQGLDRSWSAVALRHGVLALTMELPGFHTLDNAGAELGASTCLNLIRSVGLTGALPPGAPRLRRVEAYSDAAGLFVLEVRPGQRVSKLDRLGVVRGVDRPTQSIVRATTDGFVLATQPISAVRAGSWLVTLAVEEVAP